MFQAPANDVVDRSAAAPESAAQSGPPAFAPQPATAAARRQAGYAGLQRTIGNQAVLRMLKPTAPTVQRKCACEGAEEKCDDCRKHESEGVLQRKAAGAAAPGRVPAIVSGALRSPGQPLDGASRAFFEPRFGADLGGVRIHTGPSAAEASRAIQALAYTVGRDIVFGRGQYAPATSAGKALLAHELAHTLQQSGGAAPPSAISHPSDASEREADAAAARAGAPGHAPAPARLHGGGAPVQRFASEEHVKIGDLAAPGETVIISGYGKVRLGEMIAMAGDYFESLDQIEDLAKNQGQFGKDQIELVRWKVNGSSGTKPTVGAGVEEAVQTRYEELASRNQTHFSTGSTPGNSNKERYIDLHTKAIEAAYLAGAFATGKTSAFPAHIPEALEGFAQHFLTDAFSAGHVRTPRGELQTYWAGKFPDFQNNLLEFISCNMSTYIHDVDHPTGPAGVALSVGLIKDGVHTILYDRDGVRDTVKALAGDKLNRFSLGDLISVALHDADSKGLDVTSASDVSGGTKPFKWRAVGDQKLFPATADPNSTMTQNMVEAAVKFSLDEEKQAVSAGMGLNPGTLTSMTNPASYRALPLIPTEDTSSKTNVTYAWKVNDVRSLPTNVKDAIKEEFKPGTAITSGLGAVAVNRCRDTIHSGAAWECFKQVLFADPIEALAKVSEGKTCPASNPCPSLAAGAACP